MIFWIVLGTLLAPLIITLMVTLNVMLLDIIVMTCTEYWSLGDWLKRRKGENDKENFDR